MTTHIQWAQNPDGSAGETWNVASGCTKVSEGCRHCYIERTIPMRMAGRTFDKPGIGGTTGVELHPDRVTKPLHWRKPRRVFVNSMSDLFHDAIPDELIARMFAVMAATPQHTYQVLTKRPARMRSLLSGEAFRELIFISVDGLDIEEAVLGDGWPLPNVWLGASVEDQGWADKRIPLLLDTPAAVRFLSCEPLLGPIDLSNVDGINAIWPEWTGGPTAGTGAPHPLVDWVIVGGESGPGARPMGVGWARDVVGQCRDSEVPVFVKQLGSAWAQDNGAADRKGGLPDEWPEDLRVREFPEVSR